MHVFVRRSLALAFLWISCAATLHAQVYISEFVADNQVGAKVDEDGDHSDWLEIWNSGPTTVSLNGWYLTDTAGGPRKWGFSVVSSSGTLGSETRLVVFCSPQDPETAAAPPPTNFQSSRKAG